MTHDLTHIHTHTIYTYTQTTHATHPPKLTKQVGNKTKASSDLFSFAGYSSDPAPAPQLGTNKGEAQGGSGWDCPPPRPGCGKSASGPTEMMSSGCYAPSPTLRQPWLATVPA